MAQWIVHVGKANVDDLDVPGLGDEDVLEGKVTVYDIVLVTVSERAPYLSRELPCYTFLQAAMADDVVQQLTAVNVFENYLVVVLMDDRPPHTADVGAEEKRG